MNTELYNKLLVEMLERTREVLGAKAKEYVRNGDRLHNFKRAAAISGCSPIEAWKGMWMKHVVSVLDMLDDLKADKHHPMSLWREKLGDTRNYLFLLEPLLVETEKGNLNMKDAYDAAVQEVLAGRANTNNRQSDEVEVADFAKLLSEVRRSFSKSNENVVEWRAGWINIIDALKKRLEYEKTNAKTK